MIGKNSGRQHVETEASLASVVGLPKQDFRIADFVTGEFGSAQWLSGDARTGESTQRVTLRKGWKAGIGHFSENVELLVLQGHIKQGGFQLRSLSYSFVPAGIVTGPWEASEETLLLWMSDGNLEYVTLPYRELALLPENSLFHRNTQLNERMREYIPCREINAMPWESTSFLPPGSARKSLYKDPKTGRATWVLGLVPMWAGGNLCEAHPTTEEAYMIHGSIEGHWSMQDDPFERRVAKMGADGYCWRPAHVPHGPFWTESGALCFFRTGAQLDCHWTLPQFPQNAGKMR